MRAVLVGLAAVCVLAVPGCGVGSEDEPQLIEESTQEPPPATPSFDTEQNPSPGSGAPTTAPTAAPTTLSGTASAPAPAPAR
jgi:hypothetical protein